MNAENLARWVHPDFLFLVPILVFLGIVLKYRTDLTNGAIPIVLYIVAIFLASIWGFFLSQFEGGKMWYDAIVRSGLSQGFIVTAMAVMSYSSYHDTKKVVKKFKDAIKENADE